MTAIDPNATVGQIVAENPARSEVFEKLGIDYCCGGKHPLSQACAEKSLDVSRVLRDLGEADAAGGADDTDWAHAPLTELADHIEATHHAYLKEALPRLAGLADKVAAAHGSRHPETVELAAVFHGLADELGPHLQKEEIILFPMIRRLETASVRPDFHCGAIQNPIAVMEAEHQSAGGALARIRELSHDFTPPQDACNTFRALLDGLATLEGDLHRHIHKEDSILFPRAIQRQDEMSEAA